MKSVFLVVDIQNDFLPQGALGVREGDAVVPVVNSLQERFDCVIATQDWHPKDHGSFASNHPGKRPGDHVILGGVDQVLWPDHCIQGSCGAEFAPGLAARRFELIVHKGTDKGIDSYSAFYDNGHRRSTGLESFLRKHSVTDVYIAGLATDYCVKFSVFDAIESGFRAHVVRDGCRGVDLEAGDSEKALNEMRRKGARVISEADVPAHVD